MAYKKNEWKSGDIVTAEKLNNIEDGIESKQDIIDNNTNLTTKNLTVANKVKSQLVPDQDTTFNLGSSSKGWKNLYIDKIYYKTGTKTDANGNKVPVFSNNVLEVDSSGAKGTKVNLRVLDRDYGTEETVLEANPGDKTSLKFNDNEFIKGYDLGVVITHPTNYKRLFSSDTDGTNGGGINIGSDQLDLVHNRKINVIPESMNDVTYVDVGAYDRMKFGGEEYVGAEEDPTGPPTPIIMAYKRANSSNEVVPFAITKEGKAYYQGKELATVETAVAKGDDLYRITIDYEANGSRFYTSWYGPTDIRGMTIAEVFKTYHSGNGYVYLQASGSVLVGGKYVDVEAVEINDIGIPEIIHRGDGNTDPSYDYIDEFEIGGYTTFCTKIASGVSASKLYMHSIKLNGENGLVHFQLYNTSATPITTFETLYNSLEEGVYYQANGGKFGSNSWHVVSLYAQDGDTIYFNTIDNGEFCDGGNDQSDLGDLVITDDVIPIGSVSLAPAESSTDVLFEGSCDLWDCDNINYIPEDYREDNLVFSEIMKTLYDSDYKLVYLEYDTYSDSGTSGSCQAMLAVRKLNNSVSISSDGNCVVMYDCGFLITRIYFGYDLVRNKVNVDCYFGASLEDDMVNVYYNYDLTNNTIDGNIPESSYIYITKIVGIK